MTNEVTIKISASDNFSTVLSRYQNAVKGAGDATDKAGKKSTSAKDQFKQMGDVVQGVFSAAIVQKFGQAVGQLNAIGIEASRARGVFSELTKEMGGYENVLANLRTTTGGVVEDTLLMQSSNKLLLSGLAGNETELNKIIELATKLGSAMGEDAATSIENFSLMLLNQSIPRLDTFGISGAKVREEINRLIETGQAANREEAFKMAVFAEGAVAMDKLGAAVNIGSTAFDKMGVKVQNLVSELGILVSTAMEAGAQLAILFSEGQNPVEVLDQAFDMTQGQGGAVGAASGFGSAALDFNPLATVMDYNMGIVNAAQGLLGGNQNQNVANVGSMNSGINAFMEQNLNNLQQQQQQQARQQELLMSSGAQYQSMIDGYQESWDRAGVAVDRHQQKVDRLVYMGGQAYQGVLTGIEDTWNRILTNTSTRNSALDMFDMSTSGFQSAFDNLSQTTISGSGMTFYDPVEIQDLYNDLSFVNEQVAKLQELNEQGIISDEELANAQQLAMQFGNMAANAESMARNIEDLSLAELFGQGSGGQLTEAGNMVERLIGDADLAGEFNDAFNLASGAETEVSQAFEDSIAPTLAAIAETQGAESAAAYLQAYLEAIRTGQELGLTQDQLVTVGQGALDYYTDSEGNLKPATDLTTGFVPDEGMGVSEESQSKGMLGGLLEELQATKLAADDLSNTVVELPTDVAQENVTSLETMLQTIVNTKWKIMVEVGYNNPGTPPGASGGDVGGGAGSVGDQVRRNGGTVPGEDARTGAIPRG